MSRRDREHLRAIARAGALLAIVVLLLLPFARLG